MTDASADLDRPVVVATVLEPDAQRSRLAIADAPTAAVVELRADELTPAEVVDLVSHAARPLIVTVRGPQDGGSFTGSTEQRRRILEGALATRRCRVDVEFGGALEDLARGSLADRVILSHHGSPCEAASLERLHAAMAETPAARLKIVSNVSRPGELGALRSLLRRAQPGRLACFGMGRAGRLSRLLAVSWGSWGTYGSASPHTPAAAGQFSAADMLEVHDVLRIGPETRRFALVGRNVGGSPSPAMHAHGYREDGLDARYFPLDLDELAEVDPLLGEGSLAGIEALGVTMPFKVDAAKRAVTSDPIARDSGAANTIRVDGASWHASNTDGAAAVRLVRRALDPREKLVAVAGAGGTARGIAAAFLGAGARVGLFARSTDRAAPVASFLGVECLGLDALAASRCDVFVNATPPGNHAAAWLGPREDSGGGIVLDVVYGPEETRLAKEARARGFLLLDGLDLLAAQAALQYELLTGNPSSADRMRAVAIQWLRGRRS